MFLLGGRPGIQGVLGRIQTRSAGDLYIHLQKRLMSWPSSEPGDVGRAWYITPRGFL